MDRLRIDSTQALNSFVLSWTGMLRDWVGRERRKEVGKWRVSEVALHRRGNVNVAVSVDESWLFKSHS